MLDLEKDITSAELLNRRQHKEEQESIENLLTQEDAPYLPASWEHYLDLLQDLCYHRNVLVTVTAPTGAGKTTLMCQFIDVIHNGELTHSMTHSSLLSSHIHVCTSEQAQTCQIFAQPTLDKQQLLTLLTEGFHLPSIPLQQAGRITPVIDDILNYNATIEETIDRKLHTQVETLENAPQLCVLLIDNAENLPIKTLVCLLSLISQHQALPSNFHVILFGSPTLQTNLNILAQDPLNTGLILTLPLTPFSLEETKNYLEQQIKNNIFATTGHLASSTLETIYRLSEGMPAKINRIAPRLLLSNINQKTEYAALHYFEKFRPSQTKLIGGLLFLSSIFILAYFLNGTDPLPPAGVIIEEEIKPTPNPEALEPLKQIKNTKPSEISKPVIAAKTEKTVQTSNLAVRTALSEALTPLPSLAKAHTLPTEKPKAKATPTPAAKSKKTVISPFKTYTYDETYLMKLGENNYALQYFAAHTQNEIDAFKKQYHLERGSHVYRTLQNNKPWFILTKGIYSDYETARAEIKSLPENLKSLHPHVRSFKLIHQEILAAHRSSPASQEKMASLGRARTKI
ncbi:MAG: putative DamX-related protein [uncultured bacterium]|nr:MAG: putative DamX-related protein [uncultured bacterium]OGT69016.1 MAG: hypothetical protein A3I12_01570 [Gammaproteobacteria bacterium RIFCSPLOWO2_02_FULL_38_11]